MDYYRAKSMELRTEQVELTRRRQDVYLVLSRLQAQFSQESVKGNKTSGVLRLNLSAPRAGKCDFTVSYYTPSAGWAPYYDINIASTDQPITIYSKSKVRQTTGLDWEKVKLTLSTATPTSGKVAPLFSTWFLQEMRAQQREYKQAPMAMQNSYSYDMIEESVVVGYASDKMRVRGTSASSASAEPLYVIDGVVATAADVASLNASSIASMEVLKDASATSLYGSRGANGVIVVTTKSGMDDYVAVAENELNVTYDIDMPYNIPGNGKSQSIDLQTRTANAEYKYYCAPKLDAETYLLAEIADWSGLGLLSGPANITYAGTYLGETMLDASSTREKLTLTLGTDTRVSVKREKMTDFSTTRAIGSDTQQTFTYQLTVRNNQSKAIRMTLKDQYQISTMKNVQVTLNTKETTPWTANIEELGVITWEEELAPGETKTYRISYTVKYPKNMRLNL